jgi:glycosyltransferase involved in cell wall biosynthesis
MEKALKPKKQESQKRQEGDQKSLRIGIISTDVYRRDLMEFNEVFAEINEKFGDNVTIVVFGYDGSEDMPELMQGLIYEYCKPVNMIHYFKQLKSLNLDCILIPLINDRFNITSENYNKYLEASAFKIPVVVTDIYPYNTIIQDGRNGFLFKEKHDLIGVITYLLTNRHMINVIGANAHKDLIETFDYTEENIDMINDVYN